MKNINLPALSFLDVETTGLSAAYNDRIVEVAVLRREPAGKLTEFQSLINPCRLMPSSASAINGITNSMVKNAPRFSEVAPKVLSLIKGSVLVFHNAPFDLSFLNKEFEYCGSAMTEHLILDTLQIARKHFDFPSNSLGNLADYYGINITKQHRALADAVATYKVFLRLWEELMQRGLADFAMISKKKQKPKAK